VTTFWGHVIHAIPVAIVGALVLAATPKTTFFTPEKKKDEEKKV